MQAFKTHRGVIAPLDRANVDTDAIIPKQFLKSIQRTGFGENLFYDWRYSEDGSEAGDFVLNRSLYRGASILLARNNFGCGSSREHAVRAVMQFGIRGIVAPWVEREGQCVPGFADIFRNNSEKNGLLPIQLAAAEVDELFELVTRFPGVEATADLEEQRLVLHLDEEVSFHFKVDSAVKRSLVRGLDEIAQTLTLVEDISVFERGHDDQRNRV